MLCGWFFSLLGEALWFVYQCGSLSLTLNTLVLSTLRVWHIRKIVNDGENDNGLLCPGSKYKFGFRPCEVYCNILVAKKLVCKFDHTHVFLSLYSCGHLHIYASCQYRELKGILLFSHRTIIKMLKQNSMKKLIEILVRHSNGYKWITFAAQEEGEDQHKKRPSLLIILPTAVAVLLILSFMICYLWRRVIKSRGNSNFSILRPPLTMKWSTQQPYKRWRY